VRGALFLTLGGFAAFYLYTWLSTMRGGPQRAQAPTALQSGIGFVTNFFDTLGIGSFATMTSFYKL
jgi:hypothetical protein